MEDAKFCKSFTFDMISHIFPRTNLYRWANFPIYIDTKPWSLDWEDLVTRKSYCTFRSESDQALIWSHPNEEEDDEKEDKEKGGWAVSRIHT